ncbi:MAG: hypothetical protein ACYTKD_16095 [Planctomycetota bacterium]|jgi:hypothetical protein
MRFSLLFVAAALAVAGCGRTVSHTLFDWERGTGYVSGGVVPYAAFPRDAGVDAGYGYSVTMPPLLPVSVCGFFGILVLDAETGGSGELAGTLAPYLVAPGAVSGVSDEERHIVSELALDLTFTETFHDDTALGGQLEYESWLLGIRLGGPARYVPSYTLFGGWGWHKFEFENRPHARVEGPYVGAGLAFHLNENCRIGLEYERQFYTHYVRPWTPSGGAEQVRLKVTGAWYF